MKAAQRGKRKLSLNKETLADLTGDQTRMVAGGGPSNFASCKGYTDYNCITNPPSINTCVTECIGTDYCQIP